MISSTPLLRYAILKLKLKYNFILGKLTNGYISILTKGN